MDASKLAQKLANKLNSCLLDRMKTTIELPDAMLRQAKAHAAARGISLKRFFIEALEEQLMRGTAATHFENGQRPWMATFGELSDLGDEHRRILGIIEEEFGKLETEDLA